MKKVMLFIFILFFCSVYKLHAQQTVSFKTVDDANSVFWFSETQLREQIIAAHNAGNKVFIRMYVLNPTTNKMVEYTTLSQTKPNYKDAVPIRTSHSIKNEVTDAQLIISSVSAAWMEINTKIM